MSEIRELQDLVRSFIDRRDWRKFQDTKELAVNAVVESSELLELFQWKEGKSIDNELRENGDLMYHVKSELADLLFACLALSDHLSLDLEAVFRSKMKELEERYRPDDVKGKVVKNTEGKIDFTDPGSRAR